MLIKHFEENVNGIDYVVGDIHGCFDVLNKRLAEIGFDDKVDRLFSVGDLVDRGAMSEDSLLWLSLPWFHSVLGNHEQMAVDYASGGYVPYYAHNGGAWMIDTEKSERQAYKDAFEALPLAIDIPVNGKLYGIVHADCPTYNWFDLSCPTTENDLESNKEFMLWSRTRFQRKHTLPVHNIELIYVGHTPLKKCVKLGNVCYIDTGAVFGGKLTIVRVGDIPEGIKSE